MAPSTQGTPDDPPCGAGDCAHASPERPVALADVCRHRLVPLSMGRPDGDDLVCAARGGCRDHVRLSARRMRTLPRRPP
ncbi:Rieske 2Fe-2S domain-containing protein [Streptomyces sp. NPDC002156]